MSKSLQGRCVLVTGAARRIGAAIATSLHDAGADIALHYRSSAAEAAALADALNDQRDNSAATFKADLLNTSALSDLVSDVTKWHGRLDVLINNASTFYPTPVGEISEEDWTSLVGSNLKAPLFLAQAAMAELARCEGSIVNIIDIHAQRPLRDHSVYGSAKAGLAMLTRSLAKDLAPHVRVNGVAPGAILWPEQGMTETVKDHILEQIPLRRAGHPADIASLVLYLVRDADYITGQIIAVDGGRSIGWQ
jgi:pteridine reductase